jgi:hypothetical protein
MSLKVGIQRRTGAEETVIVEVIGNPQMLVRELPEAFRIVDARAWAMFKRTAEGNATLRKLGAEAPQMYLAMQETMRFLFEGDVHAPQNVEQHQPPKGNVVEFPTSTATSDPAVEPGA